MSAPRHAGPVHLVIEELVLEGIEPHHGDAVRAAMERELTRQLVQLRAAGVPWTSATIVRDIDAGTVQVATAARPERIGAQAAHALMQGVTSNMLRP